MQIILLSFKCIHLFVLFNGLEAVPLKKAKLEMACLLQIPPATQTHNISLIDPKLAL